ncbi:hypothetical protein TNCV_3637921 [Trichonephila clavipes]|nr:hypothetical protein TNCV_3637921 [Trichonephila clavipes]
MVKVFNAMRVALWFCVAIAECGIALSSNNRILDLRSSGRLFRFASCDFDRVSQYRVELMVPTYKKSITKLLEHPIKL